MRFSGNIEIALICVSVMTGKLTWGDAEACFKGRLFGRPPELSGEKMVLVGDDLAKGPESQIQRYIELRCLIKYQYQEYFRSQPIAEQLKNLEKAKLNLRHQAPNSGKDFQRPLEEGIAEMEAMLARIEKRLKPDEKMEPPAEKNLDSFVKRYYDRQKSQDNDRSL